jgi:hypothetical protein
MKHARNWTVPLGNIKGKGKVIHVTGHGGPEDCEMSRLPHFIDNLFTDISLTRRPHLFPQEDTWYSFLLGAEWTPRAIVRLEGLGQLKNPVTSSGIEAAT